MCVCVLRFLSESSLLILISSLCTLSDESLQNKVDTVLLLLLLICCCFRMFACFQYTVYLKLVLVILTDIMQYGNQLLII